MLSITLGTPGQLVGAYPLVRHQGQGGLQKLWQSSVSALRTSLQLLPSLPVA